MKSSPLFFSQSETRNEVRISVITDEQDNENPHVVHLEAITASNTKLSELKTILNNLNLYRLRRKPRKYPHFLVLSLYMLKESFESIASPQISSSRSLRSWTHQIIS